MTKYNYQIGYSFECERKFLPELDKVNGWIPLEYYASLQRRGCGDRQDGFRLLRKV